jgi:hypothetical protein
MRLHKTTKHEGPVSAKPNAGLQFVQIARRTKHDQRSFAAWIVNEIVKSTRLQIGYNGPNGHSKGHNGAKGIHAGTYCIPGKAITMEIQ